ncbi:glycosyltransferase [Methylobacterium haplocladii]|uniref:Glycosyltransferase 2-like domain-containing protein n=1 Tax=Methylobacterium haplocladii TaxID=1176176 RepID=A0A512ISS7_9HYPH|nr:glycosyltransferase [Methylobacterium haplocladii]GEP00743.1 hypothetical protein MHA02_31300 [Methylobacterium haplocladii]GJD83076.1 hypothetical protein HPGCJGGD_0938 [Methylobacterium haplocladii]GLS60955.1 hypothetical protein GCM10007887_36470 [Methylobacterium haplocladii]
MRLRRIVRRLTWHRKLDPALIATVRKSGLFNARWYLRRYPDVRAYPAGPLAHFCQHGVHEGKDPGPLFSNDAYATRAPGVAASGEPPFLHAMRRQEPDNAYLWTPSTEEALRPVILASGLFDPEFYFAQNPDVARTTSKPFDHYIRYGRVENRAPGPCFDPEYYAELYPEYRVLFPTPIEHFVLYGRARGYVGSGAPLYQRWIALHDALTPEDEAAIRDEAERDPLPPVQVLCVLDAAAVADLPRILDALRDQIGASRQATLVPAIGLPAAVWRACEGSISSQPQVRCAASLDRALGEFADGVTVLLCAGDVVLRPHAVHAFARWLRAHGGTAAYADHDRLTGTDRTAPDFTPTMSPDYLRRVAYAGPAVAFRSDAVTRDALVAAFAETHASPALPSAFLRRLDPAAVTRVPFVLSHRLTAAPTPRFDAVEAVAAGPGETLASVSIVIPTRDRIELLRPCIESILAQTDYPADSREIIVVDNGSEQQETAAYFRDIAARGVIIVPAPGPFNFSAINNAGVARSNADILVFLNNDTTVNRADWLKKLVAQARRPEIGAVGATLLYPDDTVQHAGVVLGVHGVGIHRHAGVPYDAVETADVTREFSAVTGACLAMRRALFFNLGGFDPSLEVNFNDTKLCVQAVEAGYRNLNIAEPLLYHHESKSRGYNDSGAKLNRLYREAATLIAQVPAIFRDDPAYSPNLSLTRLNDPAFPPRIVRPWRRSREAKRVLMLSLVHGQGFGVPVVLAQQAAALRARGFEVIVGGPVSDRDTQYPGCRRIALADARAAANFAVSEGVDCVVAHTQPFFSVARLLGPYPLSYAMDYGEPNPDLFPDRVGREAVNREKRLSAAFAQRVFTISRTIYGEQFRHDAIVARIGSTQLATWNADWAGRRDALRERYGLDGKFLVLNVCRFQASERHYKGIDRYVEIAQEFGLLHPALKTSCIFALAGRGDPADVALMQTEGLRVFSNVSDAEMAELYAAADAYANFSRWEGYNLGIGQALAMGLPVVASGIEAHREFPIVTSNSTIEVCAELARQHAAWAEGPVERAAVLEPWQPSLDLFCDTLAADCAAAPGPWG